MLRKALAAVGLLFVAAMIVSTGIALHYRWPAMFDAPGNPETIMTDFVWYGTRISPPVPGMVILTSAALCVLFRGWRGVAATLVLCGFSLLVMIAGAGEPATLPPNNIHPSVWFILGVIGRYAPIFIIALAFTELVRRGVSRRRTASELQSSWEKSTTPGST
jgi:hypothetical protein